MARIAKKTAARTGVAGKREPASRDATSVVDKQRKVQDEADAIDRAGQNKKKKSATTDKRPVQAGARKQPEAPFPKQHQSKPGRESKLDPAPRYQAPDYRGSGKLDGKVALVTGADSGIGRAVAVLYAREGADVAVLYLDEHDDAKVTRQAVEDEGRRCITIAGDVKDSAFCDRAVAEAVDTFGRLDILVNNAAFQQHTERLEDLTDEHLQETLDTNIGGYFHMARAALPHLQEGACIINTGSETGLMGHKSLLDYSATKGAIHAFTKSLATNLLERGIRVNCVAPGPVWTPLNPADMPAEKVTEFGAKSAMGRAAQPEEISPAYVFLASPVTASYISGIILPVMGGPDG